ncbi:MAG: restriction endonuclease [Rikenellaceae bacterium]
MEHEFTKEIKSILKAHFNEATESIFSQSLLIQYINKKTKSANRDSKSRGSFGNIYAIYVIVEDYIAKGYGKGDPSKKYKDYKGAKYSDLRTRQRELPFGAKLQNHALNNRANAEFKKYFPASEIVPIMMVDSRYWINENLLLLTIDKQTINLSEVLIEIINKYIEVKQNSFEEFINNCQELYRIETESVDKATEFIVKLLAPNTDARLFEIVSFSILKHYYKNQHIIWGYDYDNLTKDDLKLYKTGRTNANDGGIDFVMKPLGRFFQVTETLDFKKYFLDIDKIERYPITFVVKTDEDIATLKDKLKEGAIATYIVQEVVDNYMQCIEDLINIPMLKQYFEACCNNGDVKEVLSEIITQSKLEFNYEETTE